MARKAKEKIVGQYFAWCLFSRGGLWYADGRQNQPSLGKHSLGTRDHSEALEQLRRLDHQKATELGKVEPQPEMPPQEVAISKGWELYLAHCARPAVMGGAGTSTLKRYRAARDKHITFCQKQCVSNWECIDAAHITAYGAWLHRQGYADATLYLEGTLLKQINKWMIEDAKILSPSKRIRLSLRRSDESHTYCYTRDEVLAIVKHCNVEKNLRWIGNVIVALATTGMRIGELVGLRWSDLDLERGVITLPDNRHSGHARATGNIRTTKGRRTRRLPIHADFMSVLVSMTRRSDGYVFGGPLGGRLKPDTVRNVLISAVLAPLKSKFPTPTGEIGFEHGRLHSFRHFFTSQAFLGGASEGEIREWVGHRDSKIVERYRHLRMTDAKLKMDRLVFLGSTANNTNSDDTPSTSASSSQPGE